MKALRKPLSILLALIMIISLLTVIPLSASADTDTDTVQVFARKWVKATHETGDYFSFTDLYRNFIICRGNPNFDEGNFNTDDTSNVYNRTDKIELGSYNEIRMNSWNDGNGYLSYYTSTNSGATGNGKIYLSTNGDGTNFNTDGVTWYAYTWETFSAAAVEAVSPTYDATANDPYQHGVAAHYVAGSRSFVVIDGTTDGNQNVSQVSAEQLAVPYFVFKQHTFQNNEIIKLEKCNSADSEIIIPEAVPANYPDESLRGQSYGVIAGGAFYNNTTVTKVTIGENVNHIGEDVIGEDVIGAFERCSNLKTVIVGSNLNYVAEYAFINSGLETFRSTSTRSFDEIDGLKEVEGLTVECYHTSDIASELSNMASQGLIAFSFLDDPAALHSFNTNWSWTTKNDQRCAALSMECSACGYWYNTDEPELTLVADTPATCTTAGVGHYKATVTFDSQTFESHDTESVTIPATGVLFTGHSLSLNGDIGVNFYLSLTEAEAQNTTVNFSWTVDGKEKTASSGLTKDNDTGYYKASCPIAVAEMTYVITATASLGSLDYVDTYSAVDYADVILSQKYKDSYTGTGAKSYENLRALVLSMLDYGAKAQTQFNRTEVPLANAKLVTNDQGSLYYYNPAAVDPSAINIGASVMSAGLPDNLTYSGTTVVYLTRTAMRHYYKGELGSVDVTFNGSPVTAIAKGDKFYFQLENIAAADLDELYTLKIGDAEYKYSVLNYVKSCLNSNTLGDAMKDLAAATYRYNQAANAYFAAN